MKSLSRPSLVILATIYVAFYLALPASAQDRPRAPAAAGAANSPTSLTGKERLGKKWMDEQRIDNCNVPVNKRGSKPRSSTCPNVPTG